MCVVVKLGVAFELPTSYFQVKRESYTKFKKRKKKKMNIGILNRKKKNRSNVHDSFICYVIRTKNRSKIATQCNYYINNSKILNIYLVIKFVAIGLL